MYQTGIFSASQLIAPSARTLALKNKSQYDITRGCCTQKAHSWRTVNEHEHILFCFIFNSGPNARAQLAFFTTNEEPKNYFKHLFSNPFLRMHKCAVLSVASAVVCSRAEVGPIAFNIRFDTVFEWVIKLTGGHQINLEIVIMIYESLKQKVFAVNYLFLVLCCFI